MDPFDASNAREAVERVSASLGCSPTSAQVAAYFDEHDKLRHLREEFLVPKIADLPPCEFMMLMTFKMEETLWWFNGVRMIFFWMFL